jgi:D-arabinose 1-dehydrogenase-like Zn-dependent alcohol dehydrogenase
MRAMLFEQVGVPLRAIERPIPTPGPGQLLLRVQACGVCRTDHMSDIPSIPYSILWQERVVRSVANLTRRDGDELLALAPRAGVQTRVTTYPLEQANEALADLRAGRFTGAAVLVP